MSKTKKLEDLKQYIESASLSLQEAKSLTEDLLGGKEGKDEETKAAHVGSVKEEADGKIIEGVFDGQEMIGPDGKRYSIPANYASKSKLVEGDILKLTIKQDGSFVYKQIGPVARARIKGVLIKEKDTGEFRVLAEGKSYKVLLASITYYKGEESDDVVILVPEDKSSNWGAVENVIKKIALIAHPSETNPSLVVDKIENSGEKREILPSVLGGTDKAVDIAEMELFPEDVLKFEDKSAGTPKTDSQAASAPPLVKKPASPGENAPAVAVVRDLSEMKEEKLDDLSLNDAADLNKLAEI